MVGECFQTYFVLAFADTPVLFRLLQGTVGKFAFQLCFVQIVGGSGGYLSLILAMDKKYMV